MTTTFIHFPERGQVATGSEPIDGTPLKPMEVLVRSETSIISAGTELARLHGLEAGVTWPFRPGYAVIGRIESQGSGVTDFKTGDRVFFAGKHASVQRFTHGQNHEWGRLYPVPDALDAVDAAFGCLARIALTAAWITPIEPGDPVAVFGLGAIGNLAAQHFRDAGARVIGLDPVAARCATASRTGIAATSAVPPAEQVAAVKSLTGGAGAAVCVDAVGHSAVIAQCVSAVRKLGQVVLLGSARAPVTSDNVTPLWYEIHQRGLVIRGAHMWRFPAEEIPGNDRTVAAAFRHVFAEIGAGRLKVRDLVSHVMPPSESPAAYHGLSQDRDHWTAVVIDWRKEPKT